jgi:hypothetical protein
MRQPGDDVGAKVFRPIEFCTVAQAAGPGLPAPAASTARKRSDGVDKLVVWISFPMGRFSTTRDNHASSVGRRTRLALDRSGEVHQTRHPAKHALSMINQPH